MCGYQYVGVYCKVSGGAVYAFSCMNKGVLTVEYFDVNTLEKYTGAVNVNCNPLGAGKYAVRRFVGTLANEDTFTIPELATVVTDTTNSNKMVWAYRNGEFVSDYAGATLGYTYLSPTEINFNVALNLGDVLDIMFIYT